MLDDFGQLKLEELPLEGVVRNEMKVNRKQQFFSIPRFKSAFLTTLTFSYLFHYDDCKAAIRGMCSSGNKFVADNQD